MYHKDVEFQTILFLAYGLLFGGISPSLLFTLFFIMVYEFYVYHISSLYPPQVSKVDRVFINVIFLFGWIMGRILMLNETGFEDTIQYFLQT